MLCGDKIYNRTSEGGVMIDHSGAPRHALHSDRLAFKHPFSGEQMQFTMPMPRDLASWFARLQKSANSAEVKLAVDATPANLQLTELKRTQLNSNDEEE